MQNTQDKQAKAVALISGGLDSMLAAKVLIDQGVHVEGLNFYTGFCHSGHTSAIRNNHKKPKRNDALWVADNLGIKLHIVDIVEDYKDVLLKPKHGYGKNLNPCLDCKIFMVGRAKAWMQENGFDFIITGEVVGQRPNSQLRKKMDMVEKQSDSKDILLRPLSAKLFPQTYPEKMGWVDREKLFDFSGRSRKAQVQLAEHLGIEEYAQPAGGCCVLTDESYSNRLSDLWAHQPKKSYELDDIILLKVGRHMRPKSHFKLIIGRDEGENNFMEGYRKQFITLKAPDVEGPTMFIEGQVNSDDIQLSARILARYVKHGERAVRVAIKAPFDAERIMSVNAFAPDEIPSDWYI